MSRRRDAEWAAEPFDARGGRDWRRPSGIFIVAELTGEVGERIHEIQRRHDPKLAAMMPPHVTIVGSSGAGPIEPSTSVEALREALEPITRSTRPMFLEFGPPMRFMQTEIVVLPLDPHGPLRTLHERIRASGLQFQRPRFTFTPHATLNFFRTLTPERRRELLSLRVREPARIERIDCSLTRDPQRPLPLLELSLTGA